VPGRTAPSRPSGANKEQRQEYKGGFGAEHNPPADRANFAAHRHAKPLLRATGAAQTGEFALIPVAGPSSGKEWSRASRFCAYRMSPSDASILPPLPPVSRPDAAATIGHAKLFVIAKT
jgi:hypothetical protein